MFQLIKLSFIDFYKSYKKYISFALLYMLLTSFFAVPMISFIFNRMLLMLGPGTLLNADVYKIALSLPGFVGMLLISFIVLVIYFLQFGVIIIISQKTYFSKNLLISEAWTTTLRKLPKLLQFGSMIAVLTLALLIPFIDFSPLPALLDFNLPIYLNNLLSRSSYQMIALYILLLLIISIFIFRFVFTLHFIFIEDKDVLEAMKASWRLSKGNKVKLLVSIFALNALLFILAFAVIRRISSIPSLTGNNLVSNLINEYLLTISSFTTVVFSLLLIPINLIILTRLFFFFKRTKGQPVADELRIYRWIRLNMIEKTVNDYFKKRRSLFFILVLFYFTTMFVFNYLVNEQSDYLKWNVQVAAHRGHILGGPENTISSIRGAIEMGVDAIEIDVRLTKDDVLILHHDDTLQRMAGIPGKVEDFPYNELEEIFVEQTIHEVIMREKIATLAEVFQEMEEELITIIIDVKTSHIDKNPILAEKIVDLVQQYDLKERIYVQSFDYDMVQNIRKLDEEIKIGQILYLSAGSLGYLDVDFYTVRQTILSDRLVRNAEKQGREVWVWTVNTERNIKEVLKYDIHGIITDYPERVLR